MEKGAQGDTDSRITIAIANFLENRYSRGMIRHHLSLFVLAVGLIMGSGCQTAYYSAMEQFGYEKRDLLKSAVVKARDGQKDAADQFKDAMTRMQEMYGFDGGDLEKNYKKLKSEFEDCSSKADTVHKRIKDMNQVATDLFAEWDKEISQISNPTFAADSRTKLADTKTKYGQLRDTLTSAEATMDPVLRQMKDQELYLKHNLNAAAIGSLRGEATSIQNDISRLIGQMNSSIAQADEFIKTLK